MLQIEVKMLQLTRNKPSRKEFWRGAKIWYAIKNLLQMERGAFWDNHKKSVLWMIDIAKLLAVNDPSYMITFCIVLITALITSALTTKEKLMTVEATRKGMESQTLYMLSGKLSDAADIEAVIKIAVESMSSLLQVNVGCIYVGEQADPIYIQQLDKEQLHRSVTDVDEIRRKFTNLRAEYLENEENWAFPVNGQNRGDKEQRNKL